VIIFIFFINPIHQKILARAIDANGNNIDALVAQTRCHRLKFVFDAVFYRKFPLLYHKFGNMAIFRPAKLYSLCSPGNQHYQKIIYFFYFFSSKKVEIVQQSSIIKIYKFFYRAKYISLIISRFIIK